MLNERGVVLLEKWHIYYASHHILTHNWNFHYQYFSFPLEVYHVQGCQTCISNFFPKIYWLYLSCCSHRLKNINYKQMGLILGKYKIGHVIDISTMMALLTEVVHHLVWSSYITTKVCFLLEPPEILDTVKNSGQNEKKIAYDNILFYNHNHLSLSVSLLKCIKENRSIDEIISP